MDVLKLGYPIGIRKPLVEVISINNKNKNQKLCNAIIHLLEEYELKIDEETINDLVDSINGNKETKEKKEERLLDISRYKYYLTKEYRYIKKVRNIKNRLLHGEDYVTYNKQIETINIIGLVIISNTNEKIISNNLVIIYFSEKVFVFMFLFAAISLTAVP